MAAAAARTVALLYALPLVAACSAAPRAASHGLPADLRSAPAHPTAYGHAADAGSRFPRLAEWARQRIATALRIGSERVNVRFEDEGAGRLLVVPGTGARLREGSAPDAWWVTLDSVPGRRPELRLALRATVHR